MSQGLNLFLMVCYFPTLKLQVLMEAEQNLSVNFAVLRHLLFHVLPG